MACRYREYRFLATAALLLGVFVGRSELRIDAPKCTLDGLEFTYEADTSLYYQVWVRSELTTGVWAIADMELGLVGTQTWADPEAASDLSLRYYRLRQIPREEAGDEDSDALDDVYELENNTDPLRPDTDDDGMQDGAEVAQGFDPAVSNPAVTITIRTPKSGRRLP